MNNETNKEKRDQRRREKKIIKIIKINRSRQQKKNKKSIKSKIKKKPFNLFIVQKDVIEIDSFSDEEMKIIIYKFNIKSFWESEKIAFNIEIERRQLDDECFSLYLLLIVQNNKAREYIISFEHIFYHRVSLVAILLYNVLIAIKQKHFNV